jgi:hypothetical protein
MRNWTLFACLTASFCANAAVIDFETIPGGIPQDKLAISTQFVDLYGVEFSLLGGGTPYLEKVGGGDSGNGFFNQGKGEYDVAANGFSDRLGDYFLRFGTGGLPYVPGPTLLVNYTAPVSAASGEIWDIDATNIAYDQWVVSAKDEFGNTIQSITSPKGLLFNNVDSLDSKPWVWSFELAESEISSIAVSFSGEGSVMGLAFDNFSPSSSAPAPAPAPAPVPLPPTAWLYILALVSLVWLKRKVLISGVR